MEREPKPEWVIEYEEKLAEYYKEPVRPVSAYCNSFETWRSAIHQKLHELELATEIEHGENCPWPKYQNFCACGAFKEALKDDYDYNIWTPILEALSKLEIPIRKSNLLWRLIYAGEGLRTEKCPIHKGKWSGCVFSDEACPHCMHGNNVTGWLAPASGERGPGGGPIPIVLKLNDQES